MLLDLPLCPHTDRGVLASYVTKLKTKRETLMKKRSKSVEDGNLFKQFLDAEFAFPIPTKTNRSKIIFIKLILSEHLIKTKYETTNLNNNNNSKQQQQQDNHGNDSPLI